MDSFINKFITNDNSKISITYAPQNILLAAVGEHVRISFGVSSSSSLTFQWYNGSHQPIAFQNQNSLLFRQVKEEDFGWYKLLIVDCLNNQSVFTKWVELKKPQPPHYNSPVPCSCCCHQPRDYNSYQTTDYVAPSIDKPLKISSHTRGSNIVLRDEFLNAATYQ